MAAPKMVTLRLSNPLDAAQAEKLRAKKVQDYNVGDEITVPPEEAYAIISAGYAYKIDPADVAAVAKALDIPEEQARVQASTRGVRASETPASGSSS